jgi:hypothetical protein
MRAAHRTGPLCVSLALVVAASGCGASSKSTPATTVAPVRTQATSAAAPPTAPTPHLSILTPRTGAHASSTLTVRVAVSGAPSASTQRLRYVLDHHLTRAGSSHLTFRELVPGRHHLEVLIAGSTVHASTTFTVRAPAPVAVQAPPEVSRTSATPTPAAPVTPTTPAPSTGGIPQGPGAGDGDGDNHGEPSDGDGNL